MKIEIIIDELNQEFLHQGKYFVLPEENNVVPNPSHINNGFCYEYARRLKDKLKEFGVDSIYHEKNKNGIPHAFLEVNGMFYDSEAPNGVKSWEMLALYKAPQPKEKRKGFFNFTR